MKNPFNRFDPMMLLILILTSLIGCGEKTCVSVNLPEQSKIRLVTERAISKCFSCCEKAFPDGFLTWYPPEMGECQRVCKKNPKVCVEVVPCQNIN